MKAASAAAGVLLLPELKIVPAVDLHGLLNQWTAAQDWMTSRYDLQAPYVMEGDAYATCGRGMARIVSEQADSDANQLRIPKDTVKMWDNFWRDDSGWRDLPRRYQLVRNGDDGCCYACMETQPKCGVCDGEGAVWKDDGKHEDGYEVPCPLCKGQGFTPAADCIYCHGRRDRELPNSAIFGDKLIRLDFADRLRKIPGVKWLENGDDNKPIMFRSDVGISGLVMPMVQSHPFRRFRRRR